MTKQTTAIDDEAPLDPAAMLALSEREQQRIAIAFVRPVAWLLAVWGVAWTIGFLVFWAGYPESGAPVLVPLGIAAPVFGVCIAAAIVVSAVIGARMNRGIRGSSNFSGGVYGASWTIGSVAVWLIGTALIKAGMPHDVAMLFFPAGYALMVGLLYIAGAAIWQAKEQLVLGSWIMAVGVGATFAGFPTNLLVMGVLGGGGFLVGAIAIPLILRARGRRG